MPRTGDMIPSKFLKHSDIGPGVLLTIKEILLETFDRDSEEPEQKWAMYFHEIQKGLTLNKTNIKLCEKVLGSDNTDDWINKQVVLYWDDTVQYKGEIKGGIRVRAPKTKAEQDLPF